MSKQGRFRVRQTLLHTISVDLLGELSRIRFFLFFQLFCNFCNNFGVFVYFLVCLLLIFI